MKKWCKAAVCAVMSVICVAALGACVRNGGEFNQDGAVAVFIRDAGSGTREAFHKLTKIDESKLTKNAVAQNGSAAILTAVVSNRQSIAYESLGSVNETVKALNYEGVAATAANVANGTYKLFRPFNIVQGKADSELSALETDFKKFLTSKQASDKISGEGYVALGTSTAEYTAPTTALSGSLRVWGSTSVQPLMNVLGATYKQLNPGVTVTVGGSGSGDGLKVGTGEDTSANFGMVSSAIKETDNIPAGQHFTIANDGIAIIVNTANTMTNITNEQLTKLYTGEASKWSDVIG